MPRIAATPVRTPQQCPSKLLPHHSTTSSLSLLLLLTMGLLSSLFGWQSASADAAPQPQGSAEGQFCTAQFPQVGCEGVTRRAGNALAGTTTVLVLNMMLLYVLLQMWGKFVDHVVDTAYSRACTADAEAQVCACSCAARLIVVRYRAAGCLQEQPTACAATRHCASSSHPRSCLW